MSALLEAIAKGWSWKIGNPVAILSQNTFGNVIVENDCGLFWRIIPEDLKCVLLGTCPEEMQIEMCKEDFKLDWEMRALVEMAETALGTLAEGESYHLVIPGVLGGKYDISNIRKISTRELLDFSGYMAKKIENLPDGTKIQLEIEE